MTTDTTATTPATNSPNEGSANTSTAPAGGDTAANKPAEGEAAATDGQPPAKTEEAKPGEEKAGEEPGKKEGEAKDGEAADTPVEYTDFKFADGANVDEGILSEFKQFGQTHKLNQEQMQGLVDLQTKMNQKVVEQVKTTREKWRTDSENDPEFGGAKFKDSLVAIAKARDTFASQPLVDLFDQYGLSDHPEVLRHFHKLGLKISEDAAGNRGTPQVQTSEPTAAEILYGKPTK